MESLSTKVAEIMKMDLLGAFTVGRLISTILLIAVCLVVIKILISIAKRTTKRFEGDKAVRNFIMLIVRCVLYFVGILIVGDYVGLPMTSLLAVFSVAGLAVSLSLQDQLANVFGGFIIILNKPFHADDIITVAGQTGCVVNITLTYTTLRTADNAIIYVPNKDASTQSVVNFSREGTRRVTALVSASYDSDPEKVRAALLDAVGMTENVLRDETHAPVIGLNKYGASAIEYAVHVWCDGANFWNVTYGLNESIKKAFDKNGVEMTYDHINVHMIDNK